MNIASRLQTTSHWNYTTNCVILKCNKSPPPKQELCFTNTNPGL
uniref:Uncharacterized protein n=1 Tax=Arundo donax TaxID=35708 RepID=A0A0A9HPU2_ARUDO